MLTALLFVVNPSCWLQAEKAFSDASGLFFIIAAADMGCRACTWDAKPYHLFLCSLLLGLGLGVRLSYAPLLVSWMALLLYLYLQPNTRRAPIRDGAYGLVIGVCLWLAPQLALTGGLELLYDGLAFTSGHFADWGGTVVSSAAPQLQQWTYRATMIVWGFLAYGLGFWWTDTSILRVLPSLVMLVAIGLGCRQARWGTSTGFLLLYSSPYSLWIVVAQHADQPRHLLPLIP